MLNKHMLDRELRQARQARIEAQAAESDIEDMREDMRRAQRASQRLTTIDGGATPAGEPPHDRPALRAA